MCDPVSTRIPNPFMHRQVLVVDTLLIRAHTQGIFKKFNPPLHLSQESEQLMAKLETHCFLDVLVGKVWPPSKHITIRV